MMGLVRRMGSWSSGNSRALLRVVAFVCALAVPAVCAAQAVSASDRDALGSCGPIAAVTPRMSTR